MKLLPKSPMENPNYRCGYWFYYCFTIRNDYYLAAREAKRSFTIYKAVLNVKPDDKRIIQRSKSNTYGYL
jgi:prophage maintenance system killer protein